MKTNEQQDYERRLRAAMTAIELLDLELWEVVGWSRICDAKAEIADTTIPSEDRPTCLAEVFVGEADAENDDPGCIIEAEIVNATAVARKLGEWTPADEELLP